MGNGSSSNKQKIEKSFICKPRQNVKLHYICFDVRCMMIKIRWIIIHNKRITSISFNVEKYPI